LTCHKNYELEPFLTVLTYSNLFIIPICHVAWIEFMRQILSCIPFSKNNIKLIIMMLWSRDSETCTPPNAGSQCSVLEDDVMWYISGSIRQLCV